MRFSLYPMSRNVRKGTFCYVHFAKICIILHIRATRLVFVASMKTVCIRDCPNAPSDDSDQATRMCRLTWLFARRTFPKVLFLTLRLLCPPFYWNVGHWLRVRESGRQTDRQIDRYRETKALVKQNIFSLLAFYVNLHRAVIGPSATLTGRWRPDIDLRRMLTVFMYFAMLINTGLEHPLLHCAANIYVSQSCTFTVKIQNHYENTPIQIYLKFHHQKLKVFRKILIFFFIFLLKT